MALGLSGDELKLLIHRRAEIAHQEAMKRTNLMEDGTAYVMFMIGHIDSAIAEAIELNNKRIEEQLQGLGVLPRG